MKHIVFIVFLFAACTPESTQPTQTVATVLMQDAKRRTLAKLIAPKDAVIIDSLSRVNRLKDEKGESNYYFARCYYDAPNRLGVNIRDVMYFKYEYKGGDSLLLDSYALDEL